MHTIDLNTEFDYTIHNPYSPNEREVEDIKNNMPTENDHWAREVYSEYKLNLKKDHLRKQLDKCAYCRNDIEPDGKYEPIEHIVAKSIKPHWMLIPKNLIVTCDHCNNLKNDTQTLTLLHENDLDFFDSSDSFLIFNPHYDRWSDHFKIENEIFLTAQPNSKGSSTIRICKLYRYHIPINNARQIRMAHTHSYKNIAHRLYNIHNTDSDQYKELKQALDHLELRIDANKLANLKIENPIRPSNTNLLS